MAQAGPPTPRIVRLKRQISAARAEGIAAVEMEAAALYALATARSYPIVCFAHVTNTMAQDGEDFEKGPDQGSRALLAIISQTAQIWLSVQRHEIE